VVWLAEPLLSLTHRAVHFLSSLPMANLAVPIPNYWEVALLYVAILSVLIFRRPFHLAAALGVSSLLIFGDGFYWWQERWHSKELRVTHLSVGHGDAAVVEFPGARVLLIDAGGTASAEFDTGEFIVAPFLRWRKILRVDYLLVTTPRVDHYGGMRSIVEQFAPAEFWSGPGQGRTARYEGLEEAVERAGIQRVYLGGGAPCREIEGVNVCSLYPPDDRSGDASVVLRLGFGKSHFLFAGDIEAKDERILVRDGGDLSSALLKVPRHGSLGASSEEFVAAVKPRLTVFSVGLRNPFGVPREEVLSRYAAAGGEILRTDRDGAITIESDGKRIRYWTYRSGKKGAILD
jgi:competence protein ComEC